MSVSTWKTELLSKVKSLKEGSLTEPINLDWLEVAVDKNEELKSTIAYAREQNVLVLTCPRIKVENILINSLLRAGKNEARVIYLDLSSLNQVVEHVIDDQVISVQTGLKIKELNEKLAATGQWLPALGSEDDSTVLELIESGSGGAFDTGFGGARNLVLGLETCLGNGTAVKSGGKIVKNVTGYDLSKLIVGSSSWLGISHLAHLRLFAKPEKSRTAILPLSGEKKNSLANIISAVKDSGLPITTMDALSAKTLESACNYRQYQVIMERIFNNGHSLNGLPPDCLFLTCQGHQEEIKEFFDKLTKLFQKHGFKESELLFADDKESELIVECLSRIENHIQMPLAKISLELSKCSKRLSETYWHYQPLTGKYTIYEDDVESLKELLDGNSYELKRSKFETEMFYESENAEPKSKIVGSIKLQFDPDSILNPLVRW